MYEKERTYIKWKYLYYNGQTEVSDSVFDTLEDELKELGSSITNIVGAPNYEILEKYNLLKELVSGEREVRFQHPFSMLSLKKYQVTLDKKDLELFPSDIVNFFNKSKGSSVNCTPKFDGNSMELIYNYGFLYQALTRGDETGGLDRTDRIKLIVPNELPFEYKYVEKVIIRGEVIIPTSVWEEKYTVEDKVDNPRNWLAGVLNRDEFDVDVMKDIDFVAFNITKIHDGEKDRPVNQLDTLEYLGFPKVFNLNTNNSDDFFINVYPKFKEYRLTTPYLLDGIVLTFSTEHWDRLGENNHHPHYACAVKFPPNRAITYLENIIWNLGKDGEYTPIGVFKPVELDGTIVKHASLHNLGWIVDNKVYPGCKVEIAKKGEIIPQVVNVLGESSETEMYEEYMNEFIKNFS